MTTVTLINAKGLEFNRVAFDWNKDGFYSVEEITMTLCLEGVISQGQAFKIEIMKKIEDQIEALKPYQSTFEPIFRYGYK